MREEEISKLVEGTSDPAFVVDGHGRIVAWNRPAHDLFGIPAEQAIGRSCASIIQGVDECGPVCSETCVVQQGVGKGHPPGNFDMRLRAAHGPEWCNVSIVMTQARGVSLPLTIHIVRSIEKSRQMERLVRDFVAASTGLPAAEAALLIGSPHDLNSDAHLSGREIEILGLIATGRTTGDIAGQLKLSRTTVNNHVQHILRKLGVHTRLQAIRRAEHTGLI